MVLKFFSFIENGFWKCVGTLFLCCCYDVLRKELGFALMQVMSRKCPIFVRFPEITNFFLVGWVPPRFCF